MTLFPFLTFGGACKSFILNNYATSVRRLLYYTILYYSTDFAYIDFLILYSHDDEMMACSHLIRAIILDLFRFVIALCTPPLHTKPPPSRPGLSLPHVCLSVQDRLATSCRVAIASSIVGGFPLVFMPAKNGALSLLGIDVSQRLIESMAPCIINRKLFVNLYHQALLQLMR